MTIFGLKRMKGAKDGNQPKISEIFMKTRAKKSGTLEGEVNEKYVRFLTILILAF